MDGTLISIPQHNFDLFTTVSGKEAITLSDFSVVNYGSQSLNKWIVQDNAGIASLSVNRVRMSEVSNGIHSAGGLFRVRDLHADFVTHNGIGLQIDGTGEVRDVLDVFINRASIGVLITAGSAITLHNVELPGNGNALIVRPASGSVVYSIAANLLWCDTSGGVGATFDGTSGEIDRVRINNSWFSSSGSHGIAISGKVRGMSIGSGTEINANVGNGVDVSTGSVLAGLQIDGIKAGGQTNGSAIAIAANVSHYVIMGNVLSGNTNTLYNGATGTNRVVSPNLP